MGSKRMPECIAVAMFQKSINHFPNLFRFLISKSHKRCLFFLSLWLTVLILLTYNQSSFSKFSLIYKKLASIDFPPFDTQENNGGYSYWIDRLYPNRNNLLPPLPMSLVGGTYSDSLGRYAKVELLDMLIDRDGDEGGKSNYTIELKFIILATADDSFLDMSRNLYEGSLKKFGISNFLFVGSGGKSCPELNRLGIQCFNYGNDSKAYKVSEFNELNYKHKMQRKKTDIILEALELGYTVLYTDIDVVFLQNPLKYLMLLFRNGIDMAIQLDNANYITNYNTGFMIIKPSKHSRQVFQMSQEIQKSSNENDQTALNDAIDIIRLQKDSNQIKIEALDKLKFQSGPTFFALDFLPSGDLTKLLEHKSKCMVVHNNFIKTREAKEYRFKEYGLWSLDGDGYYSDSKRNYLTYSNPIIWRNAKENRREEEKALKNALFLARLLNRTLILPQFHCLKIKSKLTNTSNKQKLETMARNISDIEQDNIQMNLRSKGLLFGYRKSLNYFPCPFHYRYEVKKFGAIFDYRESTFLNNVLVPADVKRSKSEPVRLLVANFSATEKRESFLSLNQLLVGLYEEKFKDGGKSWPSVKKKKKGMSYAENNNGSFKNSIGNANTSSWNKNETGNVDTDEVQFDFENSNIKIVGKNGQTSTDKGRLIDLSSKAVIRGKDLIALFGNEKISQVRVLVFLMLYRLNFTFDDSNEQIKFEKDTAKGLMHCNSFQWRCKQKKVKIDGSKNNF